MSTPVRVAAFVAALVAAFAVAWGAGQAVGPLDSGPVDSEPVIHDEGGATHDD